MSLRYRIVPVFSACVVLFFFLGSRAVAGEQAGKHMNSPFVLHSSSGRFLLSGTNRLLLFDLGNWLENVTRQLEWVTLLEVPDRKDLLRISLADSNDLKTASVETVFTDPALPPGCIVIYDYENADIEDILESVCQELLPAMALSVKVSPRQRDGKYYLPSWVACGIAQNLYPELRARNSRVVLAEWESGQLAPLLNYLDDVGEDEKDPELLRSARGCFMALILSQGTKKEIITAGFKKYYTEGVVTPNDFLASLTGAGKTHDLESIWDRWILKQKRIIYTPGQTTEEDVKWLKGQLLLYKLESAKNQASGLGYACSLMDIIEKGEAGNYRDEAGSKALSLRILSTGRGNAEFIKVVHAYCDVLDAMAGGRWNWRLKRLFKKAEGMFAEMESGIIVEETESSIAQ